MVMNEIYEYSNIKAVAFELKHNFLEGRKRI